MGEILVECSKCGIEMKYSVFRIHICQGDIADKLDELINEILGFEDLES